MRNRITGCVTCGPTPDDRVHQESVEKLVGPRIANTPRAHALLMFKTYGWDVLAVSNNDRLSHRVELKDFKNGAWLTTSGSELSKKDGFILIQHLPISGGNSKPVLEAWHYDDLSAAGQEFAARIMTVRRGQVSYPTSMASESKSPFMCISPDIFLVVVRADISPEDYQIITEESILGKRKN